MSSIPGKAKDAAGKAADKARETQQQLEEAKGKVGFFQRLKEVWETLSDSDKSTMEKITAVIAAIIGGKLAALKREVEEDKKKKAAATQASAQGNQNVGQETEREGEGENEEGEGEGSAEATTATNEPANDNATPEELPDDLTGVPYTRVNLAKCKNFEQCQALMKANGFYLDENSGNYINREWISPAKVLNEPLITDALYEGGKKIRLKKSVMTRLKKADESMFAETGEHIKVGEHFRTNAHQFELFKKYNTLGPDGKVKNTGRVAYPGYSFHEIGQAVDLPLNWEKAQKYMWAAGFMGGKAPIGLRSDANHFSIGEISMTDKRVAALKAEGIQTPNKAA